MPSIRRRGLRFALALALLLPLGDRPAAAQAGNQLTIGITQFPSTFHPAIDAMMAKSFILAMTARPVTAYDKDWKLICMLCIELPTLENGLAVPEKLPDGRTGVAITYTLHPRATWGDGTPVTSRDAVFTWEVGRHPQSGLTNVETFQRILAVDVKDDKTFTLHIDRLTFDYNDFALSLLPAHLERPAFASPAEYKNRTTYDADSTNSGLYFGPYRITEVARGSHVVLEANPTWYGEAPRFRRIVVKTIENTAALEANLLSGSIDYIAGELGLSLDQALAFERRHRDRFEVIFKPGLVYEHIDLNFANPILADRRVRHALIYGIDREAMSRQLFDGRQPVAHSNVNPLDWVHAEDVPKYPHDPGKAAALLDEAGWTLGAGGVRRNAKGEPLSLELMTTAGNRSRELVQQVLQSQWRKLGVDVRIRNEPARVFFGETVTKRNYAAMALFAWISSPESVPRTTLHSSQIPSAANNWSGQNTTGFSEPGMDELIDRIELELDRGKRKELWRQLQHLYAEELPVLPLYFRADAYILPRWLKGVEPTGHQFPTTLWIEQWRAEK